MLHCATVANLVLRLFSPLATPGAWARGCVVAGQVARRETGTILGGVTTPLEFISCSFVSPYHASATFHATFFLQIAIRILRKVDATLTVFVTFQLPQIQRITFCLFSILTFCLITDRRIRTINKLQATFTAKQWGKPRYMQSSCTFGYNEPMHGILLYLQVEWRLFVFF